MEQARYWMWAKRNHKPDPNYPNNNTNIFSPMNSYGDSWEEQAFAEDASAGALGGHVWPPRSYSCSFCRREFRSAQALGGHMNVHRRDRARLKQSPVPSPEVVPQDHHALTTCTPQICSTTTTLFYNNSNPNLEFSEPRVSSPLCFLARAPLVVEKNDVVLIDPPSWSSFVAKNGNTSATTTLNSVDCRKRREDTCRDEEVAGCKRMRRIDENPSSLFPKMRAVDRCVAQSEVLKLCSGSSEELDLELRLGFSVQKVEMGSPIYTSGSIHEQHQGAYRTNIREHIEQQILNDISNIVQYVS